MSEELVSLHIDDKEVRVPAGTNLIEAALQVQTEIPFYCYHKHLSVAGNCRMCQVELEGAPKLVIACNTEVREGMKVRTQKTSKSVRDAQRATLEFLLINHPLDCTVCDQAGHCKLQDYYYEYNKKASRFIEDKVSKVKAEPLGPEVVYDGERCIVCTRCVRFCEEVTETNELSVLNRGDRTVIATSEGKPLDNPFSGCTVDLCPVGALTHRRWRFNSRIWYSGIKKSVCAGCSTGCNVSVAVRDDTIVQVKGRLNSDVNKEWMCDEGRYGFGRFQPANRISEPLIREGEYLEPKDLSTAVSEISTALKNEEGQSAVFISPFLTLEEQWVAFNFAESVLGLTPNSDDIAVQLRTRKLTELEEVLISPDYAPNARAAELLGYVAQPGATDWRNAFESRYERLVENVRQGVVKKLILIGDQAILDSDLDDSLIQAILQIPTSLALTPRAPVEGEATAADEPLGAHQLCKAIIPTQSVNEKSGIFVNAELRLQKIERLISPHAGSYPEWFVLSKIAKEAGSKILEDSVIAERELFFAMTSQVPRFEGLTPAKIGELGISAADIGGSSDSATQSLAASEGGAA